MQEKKWDWKDAPDWATHVGECFGNLIWFNDDMYVYLDDKYLPYDWRCETLQTNLPKSGVSWFKQRPAQQENLWDGEGIPPNGTICVAHADGGTLHKVKVICQPVGTEQQEELVAVVGLEGERKCLLWWTNNYQKIKTKEEIAAEKERSRVCDKIYGVLFTTDGKDGSRIGNRSDYAEALYDAGLRFADKSN